MIGELLAQLGLQLMFELRRLSPREIQHQDARLLMTSHNGDEQFNPIRSTVARCHSYNLERGIVICGDGSTNRRNGVEIQCQRLFRRVSEPA